MNNLLILLRKLIITNLKLISESINKSGIKFKIFILVLSFNVWLIGFDAYRFSLLVSKLLHHTIDFHR